MTKADTLQILKEKDREFRQNLIIDAAREVFGQKTYDKVSMAEIAKAAGIAKSSIYTYFKSQEVLYVTIACQDVQGLLDGLKKEVQTKNRDVVQTLIQYFLDYYITHESQWRMITHLALHGKNDMESNEKLNDASRELMNIIEQMFIDSGCKKDARLMSHTLFSCLSGILIAFRKYPGRTEKERIAHMKRIGTVIDAMMQTYIF